MPSPSDDWEEGVVVDRGGTLPRGDDDDGGGGPELGLLVLLAGVVLVVATAFVVGLVVGRLLGRRPAPLARPPVPPAPYPFDVAAGDPASVATPPAGTATVVPDDVPAGDGSADPVDGALLAMGVIAAYDLVDSGGDRTRLERALRRSGVTMILVQPGQEFDSRLHNAVATRREGAVETGPDAVDDAGQSAGGAPETIVDVVRPGWRAGGRVLRPADVTVTEHASPWADRRGAAE